MQVYRGGVVWIGVKMAGRWAPGGIPIARGRRSEQKVGKINIFLIGNLVSLLCGIIGGIFIKHYSDP